MSRATRQRQPMGVSVRPLLVVASLSLACGRSKPPGNVADTDAGAASGDTASVGVADGGASVDTSAETSGDASPARLPLDDAPIGWASVAALDQAGTTGGSAGATVTVTTTADFTARAIAPEPLVIQIEGTIGDGLRISVGSNKTVIGVGATPTFQGSLDIKDAQNIVIRNLTIRGANPDGIGMRRSHHVWVDHVDISDSSDGNLDITDQSDYVTVSWCKFWYRDPAQPHRFSNLIGSGDDVSDDAGKLKVTYHHNWWAENVFERMPRTRYGDIHVFNNYYASHGNSYCIQAGYMARLLVEGNYFQAVASPMKVDSSASLLERDNVFDMTVGTINATGAAFVPPYAYMPDAAAAVPALVTVNAGPL